MLQHMQMTVPEAAERVKRNPETVRRWIRSGRLRAQRIGTQHLIDEVDLLDATAPEMLPLPPGWTRTFDGEPMPNVVAWIRHSREGH
jgi:excisionase family DNA binding protein